MGNQNLVRGLLPIAVALLFLVQASNYSIGTLSRPGPGLFPIIVASMLLVIGVLLVARSLFMDRVPLDFQFRNIALIAASLVVFTLVSEHVNMLAGIVLMTGLASFAGDDFSILRTAVIAVVLCIIAVAMEKVLGVQLPLY